MLKSEDLKKSLLFKKIFRFKSPFKKDQVEF